MQHLELRQEIINTCLEMNELGINQGTSGNVSARIPGGFLITASGVPYKKMKPEHIVEMDLDGGYYGDYLPSTEWRMHLDIFKHRPEAGAVVHTHSTYATALATTRTSIPAFHYMIGVGGGDSIRCSDYAEFGTPELSQTMLEALKDRTACLLANHGQICFSSNLAKALWLAGEVEACAHQFWAARVFGKTIELDNGQMSSVLARFKTYGKQPENMKPGEAAAVIGPVKRAAKA